MLISFCFIAVQHQEGLAGPFAYAATLNNPTPEVGDQFGVSVAADGDMILIGARDDDSAGTDVGQAYLFDGATGALLHTFDDPTPTVDDSFGYSVDLQSNYALIGAPSFGFPGNRYGDAYLFDVTTGKLLHSFADPSPLPADAPAPSDYFGHSVAIDANHILIGSPSDDTNGFHVGQVHLFDAVTGGLLRTFDDPTPTPWIGSTVGDRFGDSVDIDGDYVLVGASSDSSNGLGKGQAYLFDTNTGELLQTFNDPTESTRTTSSSCCFGYSVRVDSGRALIGDPADDSTGVEQGQAHLFDLGTRELLHTFDDPTPRFGFDRFGQSLDLLGDNVLIGAPGDYQADLPVGQVHLFDAQSGMLLQTLDDPTGDGRRFGSAVAIQQGTIVVGARSDATLGPNVGQAYVFRQVPEPSSIFVCLICVSGLVALRCKFDRGATHR
nr:hypothetical protein [Aeoliella straminimaris]